MIKIKTKPLSVNECWQGKRFKTKKYKDYEKFLLFSLPKIKIPSPPLEIIFHFGFSSQLSDWDNPIKPLQDVLQKKYNFNDKDVFKATIEKEIVKKGDDYFAFEIKKLCTVTDY